MNNQVFKHEVITPNDATKLPKYATILVIDGGDVTFEDRVGVQIKYTAVPPYTSFDGFMPLKCMDTGTTASNIIGWRFEDGM